MRPAIKDIMLATAELWATRGTCPKKQVGAVLATPSGRLVLSGYNGAPSGMAHCSEVGCDLDEQGDCQRAVHAEANVLALAAREGIVTDGLWLWCTHFPCHKCAQLISAAGIYRVGYRVDRPYDAVKERTENIFRMAKVALVQENTFAEVLIDPE